MTECWFCGEQIREKPEIHHKIPKRYYRRGSGNDPDNLVAVHHSCHVIFHRHYDNPRWKLWKFKQALKPLNYGQRVLTYPS